MKVGWKVHCLKNSYDNVISAADDFSNQWDPSPVTAMEEVYGPQGDYVEK